MERTPERAAVVPRRRNAVALRSRRGVHLTDQSQASGRQAAPGCGHVPAGLRIDLLETFLVLAEDLHFARAASRLFLSPSGLSRRISLLEAVLGVGLVTRTTRAVELTAEGHALVPHAAVVVRAAEAAAKAVHAS